MKVQGAKKIHYDSGPNMTPLVDIVMVILIFLMLAGRFGGNEHYLVSKTPMRQHGAGAPADPKKPPPPDDPLLEIRVDQVGEGFLATVGNLRTGDSEKLTGGIEGKRSQMVANGTPNDKIQVVIEPAKNVQDKYLMQVYEAAMRAGFAKIAFGSSH